MKKILRNSVSATALAVMLGGPVWAADDIMQFDVPRWEGLYLGGHLGYGAADDWTFNSSNAEERNDGNLLGGLQAGYNWQNGDIVWGVQGDFSATGIEGGDNDYVQAEINFLATLRGRLGMAFNNILLYGTAGAGFVGGDIASSTVPTAREDFLETVFVVGGGIEVAVDERMSIGAEVLRFGDTGNFANNNGSDIGSVDGIWTGRVFMNVKMDGGGSTYGAEAIDPDGYGGNRWQGLYIGGHLGYGHVQDYFFDSSNGDGVDEGNFVGGMQVGHNWQEGDIVWGIEGDASATGMEMGDWDYAFAEVDYLASIRGRLGITVNDILIYGTAGAGFVVGAGASSSLPTIKDNFVETVFVYGGGLEIAMDDRVSIGGEVLYYGDTGTFSADDDFGRIEGIFTGRVTLNVKVN